MIKPTDLKVSGVVCLHCGMKTPVTNSVRPAKSDDPTFIPRPQISLIRCAGCGKEAPYLAAEIVLLDPLLGKAAYVRP
jgi:hypothetical protein